MSDKSQYKNLHHRRPENTDKKYQNSSLCPRCLCIDRSAKTDEFGT
ncbi:uncharacterized protein METZ01_LOCUS310547 [marine metagenome]|uniref:Uncharacterized protein n=1 Tax=marine metagenome TaxID=408172 RepID=A0A382N933_9ZZZZ